MFKGHNASKQCTAQKMSYKVLLQWLAPLQRKVYPFVQSNAYRRLSLSDLLAKVIVSTAGVRAVVVISSSVISGALPYRDDQPAAASYAHDCPNFGPSSIAWKMIITTIAVLLRYYVMSIIRTFYFKGHDAQRYRLYL